MVVRCAATDEKNSYQVSAKLGLVVHGSGRNVVCETEGPRSEKGRGVEEMGKSACLVI